MRVVVTGSRGWTDVVAIRERLRELPAGTVIVHGHAPRGADALADREARALGFTVEPHPARWEAYGKRAGFVRNRAMLDLGADLVLAFWDGESRGTSDCIAAARERAIPVEVFGR